ncbi:MAG: MepB family protein [Gammaproteobacteria bacterium]|nr:MepB family protein [Gammaproteobacteria bacterium]
MPLALHDSKKFLYDLYPFKFSELILENESTEYGACSFKLDSFKIKFRSAKITPTKVGQFVTLWKRLKNGPIQPHDILDDIDFFVISTRKENNFGQFVFSKSVLCEQGILSNSNQKGKLAIRVYPPWDISLNKQAQKTQAWQLKYFLEISENKPIDFEQAKKLFKK